MRPRIGEIRRSKGLTQKFVAEQIEVSQQQLSDWERGRNYPRADYLFKLADLLKCDVNDLYVRE